MKGHKYMRHPATPRPACIHCGQFVHDRSCLVELKGQLVARDTRLAGIVTFLRARAKAWREADPAARDDVLVADALDGAANSIESGDLVVGWTVEMVARHHEDRDSVAIVLLPVAVEPVAAAIDEASHLQAPRA